MTVGELIDILKKYKKSSVIRRIHTYTDINGNDLITNMALMHDGKWYLIKCIDMPETKKPDWAKNMFKIT